jgi:ariadne-1
MSCWTEYLNGKIAQEGESSKVQCMESGCDRIVKEEIVDRLVSPQISKK